jgi:hypothetical protein
LILQVVTPRHSDSVRLERDEITLMFFTSLQRGVKISFDLLRDSYKKVETGTFMEPGRKSAPGFLNGDLAMAPWLA